MAIIINRDPQPELPSHQERRYRFSRAGTIAASLVGTVVVNVGLIATDKEPVVTDTYTWESTDFNPSTDEATGESCLLEIKEKHESDTEYPIPVPVPLPWFSRVRRQEDNESESSTTGVESAVEPTSAVSGQEHLQHLLETPNRITHPQGVGSLLLLGALLWTGNHYIKDVDIDIPEARFEVDFRPSTWTDRKIDIDKPNIDWGSIWPSYEQESQTSPTTVTTISELNSYTPYAKDSQTELYQYTPSTIPDCS